MVVPGIVLDTWSSGSTMMVRIRYWYRTDIENGAWSIYPRKNQDPLVMKMDSALLHARPPEAGKIMLVPQIMNGKYQNIASWYDKHKRACMDLEREGRKKKEEEEIKARMALQAASTFGASIFSVIVTERGCSCSLACSLTNSATADGMRARSVDFATSLRFRGSSNAPISRLMN